MATFKRFLVYLASENKAQPAQFGYCLLDQLLEQRKLSSHLTNTKCTRSCGIKQVADYADNLIERQSSSSIGECDDGSVERERLCCHVKYSLQKNYLILSEVPLGDHGDGASFVLRVSTFLWQSM